MDDLNYEDQLHRSQLFTLEKRWLRGGMMYKYSISKVTSVTVNKIVYSKPPEEDTWPQFEF